MKLQRASTGDRVGGSTRRGPCHGGSRGNTCGVALLSLVLHRVVLHARLSGSELNLVLGSLSQQLFF